MIRYDITMDWDSVPRVMYVDAPSTEISVQDAYDTAKYLETTTKGIDEFPLCDCAGTEDLGGNVQVGLTMTWYNTLIAFEARPGPDWTLCKLTGGNMVAKDGYNGAGSNIDPRYPTAFVTVDRASSSSATTQGIEAINHMSFTNNSVITIDPINGHDIATFGGNMSLLGNPQYPVKNLTDAKTISVDTGIKRFVITSDITIDDVDLRGYTITSINPMNTLLTIDPIAQLDYAVIHGVSITGTLDNKVMLERCFIRGLEYFNGLVYNCSIDHNPIKIRGTNIASFYNCYGDSPLDLLIEFDCDGSSAPLTIRNFSGCAKITNRNVDTTSCINFTGELVLDSTCTTGQFDVSGNGDLTDNTTGDAFVIKRKLTHPDEIADRVWEYERV